MAKTAMQEGPTQHHRNRFKTSAWSPAVRRGGVPRGGASFGGGGFLLTMQFPGFSNFLGSSVTMVCHRATQRDPNKDKRHSTTFKESITRPKHIATPATKNPKKLAPWAAWRPHYYLSKLGGGGWGGGVACKERA